MSTIVVVKKDDIIAIGADTLAKLGSTKESAEYIANSSKILRVGDSYIACVGHASFGLVLESYFAGRKAPAILDSPRAIFETARDMHKVLKEKYFLNPAEEEKDEFESSRLFCLIANAHGIFGLYSLRSVAEYTKFYAFGTGDMYALGAMRAVYGLGYTAGEIARAGLEAAADFDDSTGLPAEIHVIRASAAVSGAIGEE